MIYAPMIMGPRVDQSMIKMVNQARREAGLYDLELSDCLSKVAEDYAKFMAEWKIFQHGDWRGRIAQCEGAFPTNENIAAGYPTAAAAFAGWMESEGHRRNILSTHATHVGFGLAIGGFYGTYWVMDSSRQ